jgi:hypothetical protein
MDNLKWFCFSQNNSGGNYVINDDVGHYVFIQAASTKEAIIAAYVILDDSGTFWCACCGPRWYFDHNDLDAYDEPTTDSGTKLSNLNSTYRNEIRLYYHDGRKESLKIG